MGYMGFAFWPENVATAIEVAEKKVKLIKARKFTKEDFNVIMNMERADKVKRAKARGMDNPKFYAEEAYDWLVDADGGSSAKKVSEYFHAIVKPAM